MLNIGAFFALLFIAAYRLPGGVAAIVGGLQPLIIAVLATRVLRERLSWHALVAGGAGVVGVSLIVLQSQARLDAVGIVAALGGTASMAVGVVLTKRWGQPAPALTTTAWQLSMGGVCLLVALLVVEGLPDAPLSAGNLLGYGYLSGVGTALAYVLWFRGIARLPARTPAFLGLLSPVVAILLGWLCAGELLTTPQILGIVIVLSSVIAGILGRPPKAGRGLTRAKPAARPEALAQLAPPDGALDPLDDGRRR
jgi:drug/metabolite transporter (DMT)-like permease